MSISSTTGAATVATAKRPTNANRAPRPPAYQLLRDRILDGYKVLQKERSDQPAILRKRIEELESFKDGCVGPMAYRRRIAIDRFCAQLRSELNIVESGSRICEYKAKTTPYLTLLDAWMRHTGKSIPPPSPLLLEIINSTTTTTTTNTGVLQATTNNDIKTDMHNMGRDVVEGDNSHQHLGPTEEVVASLSQTSSNFSMIPKNVMVAALKDVGNWTDQDLLDDYMAEIEGVSAGVHVLNADTCATCKTPMVLSTDGSMIMCHTCGHGYAYVDATSSAMAYGDEVEFSTFTYRKYNHFVEFLAKFTYQESGVVPPVIMENVMKGLEEDGVRPDEVDHQKVYAVLKRLSYRKYYDYLSQITTRITNKPPPKLSPEETWTLKLLFRAIQAPFERHCPQDRTNFLSCQFVADCLLRLINREDLIPYLRPLKGADKRAKQRATMEKILAELGLKLPPSAYIDHPVGDTRAATKKQPAKRTSSAVRKRKEPTGITEVANQQQTTTKKRKRINQMAEQPAISSINSGDSSRSNVIM